MALFYPIVVDSVNEIIKELPANDTLNLSNSDIQARNFLIDGFVHHTILDVTGTGTCDLAQASYFKTTLSGPQTITITNPPAAGTAVMFMLEVVNTGSHAISWPGTVIWDGGVAPVLPPTSTSTFSFLSVDGGTVWRANLTMNTTS